jgi:hypothetical protein
LLIDTGLRDWKAFPLGDDTPTAPGPNYKRGFSVLIFAPKLFDSPEVFEMCSSTGAHMSFCERLYNEAEPNFDKGTVPIVKITEAEPIQIGRGKSRELRFTIVKWIARPPEFTIALAKLKAAAGGAPDKSAGAAADGGDDFDDGSVGAGGNDFDDDGGAGGAVVDEPADGTKASAKAGKAKKGRGKAQAEPPKPSSDILDDPINDPIPY